MFRPEDCAELLLRLRPYRACASRHPGRAKSEGEHFLHGASTPPLRGGESPLPCRIHPILKFLPPSRRHLSHCQRHFDNDPSSWLDSRQFSKTSLKKRGD